MLVSSWDLIRIIDNGFSSVGGPWCIFVCKTIRSKNSILATMDILAISAKIAIFELIFQLNPLFNPKCHYYRKSGIQPLL